MQLIFVLDSKYLWFVSGIKNCINNETSFLSILAAQMI